MTVSPTFLRHGTVRNTAEVGPRTPKRPALALAVVLAGLSGLLVVLWARARPWDSRMVNTPAKLGAASGLAALIGLLLFSVTIVLSARLRYVEGMLRGLDHVYRVHHRTGAIAFALLAAHPVLLAWRYAQVSWERAAKLWWPTASDWPLVAGQIALYGMAAAIVVTLYVAVRHQAFVWTQRLLGVLLFPAAYHALFVGGDTATYQPLRWYVWCIVGVGAVALVAHTFLGRLTTRHRAYRVTSVVPLPGSVTELWLRPISRPLSFLPGQFVFARFHSTAVSGEPHPFSIASSPATGAIRFTVKDLGDYTKHVGEIEVGAEATIEGPYGRFSHQLVSGRRQVWLAGGIGIAPFLSMAAALPASTFQVDLFYGFLDARDAPFLDELRGLATANAGLRVHFVDENVDGFISVPLIMAEVGSLDACEFLLCGPREMMHLLRDQLVDAGVSRDRVHFEEFGFA